MFYRVIPCRDRSNLYRLRPSQSSSSRVADNPRVVGSHRPRLHLFNVRSPDQSFPSNDESKSKSHHCAISLNVTVG